MWCMKVCQNCNMNLTEVDIMDGIRFLKQCAAIKKSDNEKVIQQAFINRYSNVDKNEDFEAWLTQYGYIPYRDRRLLAAKQTDLQALDELANL